MTKNQDEELMLPAMLPASVKKLSPEDELTKLRAKVAAMEPVVTAAASVVSMWLDIEIAQDENEPDPWKDREVEGNDRITAQMVAVENWWSMDDDLHEQEKV